MTWFPYDKLMQPILTMSTRGVLLTCKLKSTSRSGSQRPQSCFMKSHRKRQSLLPELRTLDVFSHYEEMAYTQSHRFRFYIMIHKVSSCALSGSSPLFGKAGGRITFKNHCITIDGTRRAFATNCLTPSHRLQQIQMARDRCQEWTSASNGIVKLQRFISFLCLENATTLGSLRGFTGSNQGQTSNLMRPRDACDTTRSCTWRRSSCTVSSRCRSCSLHRSCLGIEFKLKSKSKAIFYHFWIPLASHLVEFKSNVG